MLDIAIAAWDVGGAHLKCALFTNNGNLIRVSQNPTPLWKGEQSLKKCLLGFKDTYPDIRHVITMTAELVDYYANREEGVLRLAEIFIEIYSSECVYFYAADDGFIEYADIANKIEAIASMNWHATAAYASINCDAGILIDIGSSTCDIIPYANRRVLAMGKSDHQRLLNQELLYFGVVRTAIMAVCDELEWRGESCSVMNELFATTADVYRLLQYLQERDDLYETADGKDKTVSASAKRLARMIALDYPKDIDIDGCIKLAEQVDRQLQQRIKTAIDKQRQEHSALHTIVGAGCGRFMLEPIAMQLGLQYIDFFQFIDTDNNNQHQVSSYATSVSLGMLYIKELCNT